MISNERIFENEFNTWGRTKHWTLAEGNSLACFCGIRPTNIREFSCHGKPTLDNHFFRWGGISGELYPAPSDPLAIQVTCSNNHKWFSYSEHNVREQPWAVSQMLLHHNDGSTLGSSFSPLWFLTTEDAASAFFF